MADKEKFKKTFDKLHASTDILTEVLDMTENRKNKYDEKVKQSMKMRRIVAACLGGIIIFAGGIGVYATIDFGQKRFEEISDSEKQSYIDSLEYSTASADSFSRELTDDEKIRLEKLSKEYELDGKTPVSKIIQIDDENDLDDNKLCFFVSKSIFYIPKRDLSDEELLQIIDFYNLRDKSLINSETIVNYDTDVIEEISNDKAVALTKEIISNVYDEDVNEMKFQIDYQPGSDGVDSFSTDYVLAIDGDNNTKYCATVDLQLGKLLSIERADCSEKYGNGLKKDENLIFDNYTIANHMASEFVGNNSEWEKAVAVIYEDNNNIIRNGIINYYFYNSEGDVCEVSYSQLAKQFYKISVFSQEQIIEKLNNNERNDGYIKVNIEMNN